MEKRAGQRFIHYLDDFFTVHRSAAVCRQSMNTLKQVCHKVQMLIAPEKSEGPSTVVKFLGLTIDTNSMVIRIPHDKLQDTVKIISKMIKQRKATSWELQSLAGKLNFVARAVPAGKCFIKQTYQSQAGIPHNWHVDLRSPVLSYLQMWKVSWTSSEAGYPLWTVEYCKNQQWNYLQMQQATLS